MAKPEHYRDCHCDFPRPTEQSDGCPQLTRREVVSIISKYIDELDDLVLRKIEGLLQSFNRPLCLNEAKILTKYF